ncbi:TIGR01212 family radical SAM protein [Anaerosacchariphilus polymeriproducens]|uniref:TIGR01212 family radical SAM protein n=1 Tax=Anaerosacchariphilus polymeriproducens TaxID=1812858 RepID=A0A371AU11_9FIRM|nr:TIGR01212 family radical SAM protein [Anaerosacchariphilus polymeriproducens]RDU23054.1 TIGR01212 family radical SAM protein [Anaerosacchariphilus polymeriproducens]
MKSNYIYNTYSTFLQNKYGEKVYKLPINLPISCPNRIDSYGCSFCSELGTGFEAHENTKTVLQQLEDNKHKIQRRYHANKFIAYFQNYTNTFIPFKKFKDYILEALSSEDIVEISIATRPDCIEEKYLNFLRDIKNEYHIEITFELGLQTINYHTLDYINRGHGLAAFLSSVLKISSYSFPICVHVILNLPNDTIRDTLETANVLSVLPIQIVKIHSLYIPKNTRLCYEFENGTISLCSKQEYLERLVLFIENIRPDIIIERLFSRVPQKDAVFSNWGTSWWKLRDEFLDSMIKRKSYQGIAYQDLARAALDKLDYK